MDDFLLHFLLSMLQGLLLPIRSVYSCLLQTPRQYLSNTVGWVRYLRYVSSIILEIQGCRILRLFFSTRFYCRPTSKRKEKPLQPHTHTHFVALVPGPGTTETREKSFSRPLAPLKASSTPPNTDPNRSSSMYYSVNGQRDNLYASMPTGQQATCREKQKPPLCGCWRQG